MIPIVNKNFEMFDSITYERLYRVNPYNQCQLLSDGSYIEMIKAKVGYSFSETPPSSYFTISKSYYLNGNIRSKGLSFNWFSFQKGLGYEFDESGKLVKEIDYDKPYDFTFEDIVKFCENEKITLHKGPILQSTGYHTVIRRGFNNNSSWWQIEWLKQPDLIEVITLDGNTGKVLKRENQNFVNN